jgi:P27 family predicted phage terminase small subunit
MGRTPKSPTEKRLTGAGKRATPAKAPAASARPSKLAAPSWLVRSAQPIWRRIVPELLRLNLMSPGDADVIGRYCTCLANWIRAARTLDKEGLTIMVPMTNSEHSMPRRHPAVQVLGDMHRQMIDLEDRFGGSPIARYRLVAQQAAHPGAIGDLFGGGKPSAEPSVNAGAGAPSSSPVGALQRPVTH